MAQAKSLPDFAGNPLAVVAAGSGHDAAWLAAQADLATLSTNTHRVVPGATHPSLLEVERDAAASSRAVADVVASVRTGRPLRSYEATQGRGVDA